MSIACGCGVSVAAPSLTGGKSNRNSPQRRSLRFHPRGRGVAARFSGKSADADTKAEADSGRRVEDDPSYLLKLGLGSVAGAAAIKYGSILLPDITRPNIVVALSMVCIPVAVAVVLLLKAGGSRED
uniref:Uncharacterized protein n=1 Tax=Oryza brachyantha TaxID=4533 RepID=J3LI39_ORYBR